MRRGLPLLLAPLLGGCSYDWTGGARGVAVDAGPDVAVLADAAGVDAPVESSTDASVPMDASPPVDAATDTQGVDCAALEASLATARAQAVKCVSSTTACSTTVINECGCQVAVGDAQSTQVATYQGLVQQFAQASCPRPSWCATCVAPTLYLCIVADAGGNQYACYQ